MAKYLDHDGLLYFWQKIKERFISDVNYDTTNKKITKTKNGTTNDVVSIATVKSDMALSKSDVGLGNVENKSSATIRGELTSANVTNALGYTPPEEDTDTKYGLSISGHTVSLVENGSVSSVTVPDNNTWNANSKNVAGYVSAPGAVSNKVWKTDASGNPGWRDDANTQYLNFTPGTTTDAGAPGLVPGPGANRGELFGDYVLVDDGSWHTINDILYGFIGEHDGYLVFDSGDLTWDDSGSLITGAQVTKLAGIADGAEVNQNAYGKVSVDGTVVLTAGSKTASLNLITGSNITLSESAGGLQISATDADTKNTAGSTADASKLYIIGAKSQAANPQTYSQANAYITAGKVYSNAKEVVNLSDSQALTNKTYNGYTLAAACAKSVDTSIASSSTSTNLPTSAAVAAFVASQVTGASAFQGSLGSSTSTSDYTQATLEVSSYIAGWYWVVNEAGTYVGHACEVGDMVYASKNKGSSYSANDFTVVQNEIDRITNSEIDTMLAA